VIETLWNVEEGVTAASVSTAGEAAGESVDETAEEGAAALGARQFSLGLALDPYHVLAMVPQEDARHFVTQRHSPEAATSIVVQEVRPLQPVEGFDWENPYLKQVCALSLVSPLAGVVPAASLFEPIAIERSLGSDWWIVDLETGTSAEHPTIVSHACDWYMRMEGSKAPEVPTR
jgi:hypothetical protein